MKCKFTREIGEFEYEIEFSYKNTRYCTNIVAQTEDDAIRRLKSNFTPNQTQIHSCVCRFKIV